MTALPTDPVTSDRPRSAPRPALWIAVGFFIASMLTVLIVGMLASRSSRGGGEGPDGEFVRSVDLRPLDRAAVLSSGRLKSYDSFASEMLGYVSGRARVFEQRPDFTYLDMMFRPERYASEPIIYVKNPAVRGQIAAALAESKTLSDEHKELLEKKGLVSRRALSHPAAQELIQRLANDVVRTAKVADGLRTAIALSDPGVLRRQLRVVPPPSGREDDEWLGVDRVWSPDLTMIAPGDEQVAGLTPALATQLRVAWTSLSQAWRAADAPAVNQAVSQIAALLPQVAPAVYPDPLRMQFESAYFAFGHLTWVWLIYLVALALLLMAVVYKWDRAQWIGWGVFAVAFGLHTLALGWRWYAAGRWPNSNMFEAVTTSVWLGTLCVIAIERFAYRSPMRNLFLLGASASCMAAMMAANYVPQLTANINNMMPVLHDLWLYIHTNVIIASYALIAMAAVTGLLYIGHRLIGGEATYARVGGAAALLDPSRDQASAGGRTSRSPGEIFDGATMVLMELSFVLLWAGIVMGAIWADHSWGRPWGWDPKEVFALNTFLVFLVLVHVRLKVRDKGLWTAVLAIIGCAVMLFNWIAINFVITGLHSYA